MPRLNNINGGVVVAIYLKTTPLTLKNAVFQLQFLLVTTLRTCARCAFPSVNDDHPFAVFDRHPLRDLHKLGKPQITHLFAPQPFHTLNIQIFKHQCVIVFKQQMNQLKVEIASLVCDPNVTTGKVFLTLDLILTPLA